MGLKPKKEKKKKSQWGGDNYTSFSSNTLKLSYSKV